MANRLHEITTSTEDPEDCADCGDEACDRHWLVEEVHRLRGAIDAHREKVEMHRTAARERHAELAGEDDLHGIHQNLWAAVDGRDTPV